MITRPFTWNNRQYTASIDADEVVDITSPLLHVQGRWADGLIHDARYRPRATSPVPTDLLEAAEHALLAPEPMASDAVAS